MSNKSKENWTISIDGRIIGTPYPPYVIAELSANHNGSLQRAFDSITMAKRMGAAAVKLQTYTADTITIDSDKEDFLISGGLWDGMRLYELYEKAHTPFEWHGKLFNYARELGITCFSTPFDETAVDLLEELRCPAYKIASFEAVDLPLIRYVAATKKPLIISTGMADLAEIEEAVHAARESGCSELALLHCVSGYPTPVEESNLLTISDLAGRFDVVSGLSDHTLGTAVSVAGVALGASIIEKHVTISRSDKGLDSDFSLEPDELQRLCKDAHAAWQAVGTADYSRKPAEKDNAKFRRSIYAVRDIEEGEQFTRSNIRRIRPGYGLPPKMYDRMLGKVSKVFIEAGTPMREEFIAD